MLLPDAASYPHSHSYAYAHPHSHPHANANTDTYSTPLMSLWHLMHRRPGVHPSWRHMRVLMPVRMLLPDAAPADTATATAYAHSYPHSTSYPYANTIVQWVARLRRYSKMLARPRRYVSLLLPGHGHLAVLLRQELYAHSDCQRLARTTIGSKHATSARDI